MGVNLTKKGQKVDLTKGNPGLAKIEVGLGWDTNKYDGGHDFDLDASIFMLTESGKVRGSEDFIFYGNENGPGVTHTGDNRTGEGDGDDESILVDLDNIPAEISKLAVTVTIHEAEERGQTFGQVSNAYVRVLNDGHEELIRFDLEEDFSIETAIVAAEIYRHDGEWKFSAVGAGYMGGLASLCNDFGVVIA